MKLTATLRSVIRNSKLFFPIVLLISALTGFGIVKAFANPTSPNGKTCEGVCVNLTKEGMTPDELAIKVGTYVQFNAADGKKHNISLGEGAGGSEPNHHAPHAGKHEHTAGLASGDFAADEAWRAQFKTAGTYHLHDHYNPDQNILVVVYN